MKIRKVKEYIPLIVSLGVFMSLFIMFNINTSPPEIEPQLSPRHSSYFDEFGKPSSYSSPYISGSGELLNVRVNGAPGTSEPVISANPQKEGTFAIVSNNFDSEGYGSVFITGNGGMEWKQSRIPLTLITVNDMYYSDPWAEYGADGSLAYVTVAMRSSEYTRNVVFNISHDDGNTWSNPVTIKTFESKDVIFDKPKVRFDKDNNIYIVWLEESKDGAKVSMCISKDGGKHFSEIKTISEGGIEFVDIFFDNGSIYAILAGHNQMELITSKDNGATWSSPVKAAEFEPITTVLNKQRVIKSNNEKGIRVNSDPQAVIVNGKIFLTFAAKSNTGDNSEVYTVTGDLNTMDFTEPKPIEANSTTDKFLPAISTDGKGGIYILYYSSQNDPGNLMTEAYLAASGDLGNTFTYTNLSTESFDPHDVVVSGSYMGDYISLAINKDKLIAVWTDGRSGNLDLMAGIMPVKF